MLRIKKKSIEIRTIIYATLHEASATEVQFQDENYFGIEHPEGAASWTMEPDYFTAKT